MEGFLISLVIGAIILAAFKFKEDLKKKKGNINKIYKSEEEAAEAYEIIITKRLMEDKFYLVKVSCSNCKLRGTIYIQNNIEAEGSACPSCFVENLKVTGKAGKKIIHTPDITEQTAADIQATVELFVQEGLSNGTVIKDDLFRGW